MKKLVRILMIIILLPIAFYRFGPKFPRPVLNKKLPTPNCNLANIEEFIQKRESLLPVKPDNESRIFWADSSNTQTEYCLLYLHGFSASWFEGEPIHRNFARHFGMNAYLPRLADHGLITEDPLLYMTPDSLYDTAKEALVLAHQLGQKVILMGTSTGGTLALKLAADFPEMVNGLVLLSPNIRINNSMAFLLSGPWGLQITHKVFRGNYRITNDDFGSEECKYWNCKYRTEAIVYLQQLVDATMNKKTFEKVKTPLFVGYYYKDKKHQDSTVRVDAIQEMFKQVASPDSKKREQAFPNAGGHVIGCGSISGAVEELQHACFLFGSEILGLQVKKETE